MDLVSGCKDKLAYFRIKELKDVLSQLGLAKQGKKQDLVDRILALLSDEQVPRSHGWAKRNSIGKEGVAKIIDDTYRKMQGPGATDLASKSRSGSELNHVKPKEELNDSYQLDMKVRCPCGKSLLTDSMIKCEDSRCQVWQHIDCVIIPEKAMEGGSPEVPSCFYCEICRLNRADPFWVTMAHPLFPVKLHYSGVAADGTNTVQSVDRTFQLSRSDCELLLRTEYDLQVWCILLNDKVPFRMQWPQYTDLQVNGMSVRTTNRPGTQLLGINGRDDGPVITSCHREGINKICLSRYNDAYPSSGNSPGSLGSRLSVSNWNQVLSLLPREADGERFEDALARVRRCIGGGNAAENADSDSDLEVVADSVTVNLRCPMSGSRMKIAGRFKPCIHMGCFDLETFVELNQRSRKWQCPICLKNYSLENIIIDPYFNRITSLMQNCGEDVTEIDVKPDGSWRAKNEAEHRDLAQWHLPDSSLCPTTSLDVKPDLDMLKQIKQEGIPEGHTGLKLGIKRNRNGIWEVSKPEELRPPFLENNVLENFENPCQNIMPMSSSATGSYRDGEDPSVNQEGGGHFDFSLNNGHEFDSVPLNFDQAYNPEDRILSGPLKDSDVIVLSDSEEDNVTIYDTRPANGTGNALSANHTGVSETYAEDPALRTAGTSCLGLFNNDSDDFGMPLWTLPTGTQTGPGFQLFGTDSEVRDTLVDVQRNSLDCPISSYGLASDGVLDGTSQVQNLPTCRSTTEMNGSLVDNPMAFGSDDPSLQIFLPTRPVGTSLHADSSDRLEMANGSRSDDWISLRLGGACGGHGESTSINGFNSTQQLTHKESGMETLANTASLLLSRDDDRVNKATSGSQRSDGPFSHPRQPRSVRPRLFLSIDTDSD